MEYEAGKHLALLARAACAETVGGSLAALLKKVGRFPELPCICFTMQILDGLMYLHARGIVHRDVKGCNLLYGIAYLLRFKRSRW